MKNNDKTKSWQGYGETGFLCIENVWWEWEMIPTTLENSLTVS